MTGKKDKPGAAQVDRKPASSAQVKPKLVGSGSVKSAQVKTAAVKPKLVGSGSVKPAQVKTAAVKPKSTGSGSVRLTQVKPAQVKPAQVKPAQVKPAQVKPAAVKPKSTGSGSVRSTQVKPAQVKPAQVKPAQVKSGAVKPKLVGSGSVRSAQVESALVVPAPAASSQPEPKPTKPRGLLHYLGVGVSAGLLAFVLLIAALAIVVPAISGSTPMTILTGSMTPTYPAGTLVIIKPVNPDTLVIGDPITYQIESGKPAVVTHRIIAITSVSDGTRTFTTQGDANNTADPKPVLGAQVRGKVWYSIPYLGWVNSVVNGQSRAWLIPLIAIALFGYAGYQAASGIAGAIRKRRAAKTSPSGEETPNTDIEAMPELVDAGAHAD